MRGPLVGGSRGLPAIRRRAEGVYWGTHQAREPIDVNERRLSYKRGQGDNNCKSQLVSWIKSKKLRRLKLTAEPKVDGNKK